MRIQGVVGAPVATPLVALDVKLYRDAGNNDGFVTIEKTLNIVFAVTNELSMQCDAILPTNVVDELKGLLAIELIEESTAIDIDDVIESEEEQSNDFVNCDALLCLNTNVETNNVLDRHSLAGVVVTEAENSSASSFATEQRADFTFNDAFKCAEDNSDKCKKL